MNQRKKQESKRDGLIAAALVCTVLLGTVLLVAVGCTRRDPAANSAEARKAFRGGTPPPGEGEYIREQMRKQQEAGIRPPPGAAVPYPKSAPLK